MVLFSFVYILYIGRNHGIANVQMIVDYIIKSRNESFCIVRSFKFNSPTPTLRIHLNERTILSTGIEDRDEVMVGE
jgi:hypothetical protein